MSWEAAQEVSLEALMLIVCSHDHVMTISISMLRRFCCLFVMTVFLSIAIRSMMTIAMMARSRKSHFKEADCQGNLESKD